MTPTPPLGPGDGVWLRGAPGSGRTRWLKALADGWAGDVVWLRSAPSDWLARLPDTALVVIDDASPGLSRSDLSLGPAVVATGPEPGEGWRLVDLPKMDDDSAVALFFEHAPGAGPLGAVRKLVALLDAHPTAILAAARRWPEAPVQALLRDPSPGWPGLRAAWDALPETAQATLAFVCRLPGATRREGLDWCGRTAGLGPLIGAGWARVTTPGTIAVPRAIALAVQPWRDADPTPYLDWFAEEAQRRVRCWDQDGGARAWFRAGLWPTIWAARSADPEPWLLRGWSLSGESPAALLDALHVAEDDLQPLVYARCAARANQALGARAEAVRVLSVALASPDGDPAQRAFARLELGVAHHRLRQLDDAQAAYEASIAALDALGLARGRMLGWGNLAAIAHDRAHYDDARAGYESAIAQAASLAARRLQGIFLSNLGALLLEVDKRVQARTTLRLAVRCLLDEPDDRLLAIARVNQAAIELLDGHLDAADAHYAAAIMLLGQEDPASRALCHARRGAVAALRGDLHTARKHHDRADATVPSDDPLTVRVVALWRALVEWSAGDRVSALARRHAALSEAPPLVDTSDEARLVVRLLERAANEPGAALVVGAAGAWVQVPGRDRVDVARYGSSARILACLAQSAENRTADACDADTLIAAGWPGERILPGAARNRLGVALARLRKLGLRDQIQKTKAGWRLDPSWSVVLLRRE